MTETTSMPSAKTSTPLRSGFNTALRQVLAIVGLLMIAMSIPIGILTPLIPIGLPFGILGVVLLGRNSVWGHRWMESVLARHPKVERFAPNWLMKLVFAREKKAILPRKK
ncbi:hypothetical protein [Hyphomonas johnsonii]|nr:hypothetical protein [Hyphomonas johnsonii]